MTAPTTIDGAMMSDDLNQMTTNQRRALDADLAALDTMAATWAAEVRLHEIAKHFAAIADPEERATRIAAMVRQGFSEGAYRHYLDHKDAIALLSASKPAAPEGWKLVPIEPTEEMLERGALAALGKFLNDGPTADHRAADPLEHRAASASYAAMLAASPAAPTAQAAVPQDDGRAAPTFGIPLHEDMLRALEHVECVYRLNVVKDGEPSSTLDNLQRVIKRARAASPQPQAQTERALTVTAAMVKAAMPWLTSLHHMRKTDKESNVEEAIRAALTAAQPASDGGDRG